MGKLSDKEQEVLDFLLDFVNMEIFSIEQQERDLGRLDYSLCSDDDEKQTITTKKVQKFKKRISKCNPIIAGYINCLTTPDPLNTEFEELRERFNKALEGKEPPIEIGFHFVRKTKHKFDFNNANQIIADLLTAHGIIEDDNMDYFIPYAFKMNDKFYTIDKENPGVYLQIK